MWNGAVLAYRITGAALIVLMAFYLVASSLK